MPTKNPRLTLTLSPSLAAQLRRLSELTGNSQAALISELLEGNEEVFARLIKLLEAAHAAKGDMVAQFSADMEKAQSKIEKQMGLALDALEVPTHSLLPKAEKIVRRRARSAAEGPLPRGGTASTADPSIAQSTPISNRGVRFSNEANKAHKENSSTSNANSGVSSVKTSMKADF